MTYVIHGATGAQGAPVVSALAAAGKPVIALTRNADADVPGARVMTVGYSSEEGLTHAYAGADGVFIHLPLGTEEDRRTYARSIVAAVHAARPGRVVFSTSGYAIEDGDESAVSTLIGGLADSGVPYAVIAPELFFENLLLPHVVDGVRERGVLGYPLPAAFSVSWASHLDIADVAVTLFERPDVSGVVGVGQYPAITGAELAKAFGRRLGREVTYQAAAPEEYFGALAPMIGEGTAAGLAANYRAMAKLPGRVIAPERSAQKLLGVTPRTAGEWLADMGLR
ncbi:NmrA family NAD(P)-binding protein [Amycolatopsis sp. NEAU-NG30]|uniref:NmrA family NAD(P)-binding protein n=1 Tax=Amycolatopsis melonis TaxID=3156488 RepID=A0ABV0L817_9PSEU